MVQKYGVGPYGSNLYSAPIAAGLSGAVSTVSVFSAPRLQRERGISGGLVVSFGMHARMYATRNLAGDVRTMFQVRGVIRYLLVHPLSGSVVVISRSQARLSAQFRLGGGIQADFAVVGHPYLGPFWNPENPSGDWIKEPNPDGLWTIQESSGDWSVQSNPTGIWTVDPTNSHPWGN